MRRVTVTVPAPTSDLGVGWGSLALALGLHNTLELSLLPEGKPGVQGYLPAESEAIILRAVEAVFKAAALPIPPINARGHSNIPPERGLGDRSAWLVGGIFGANNLLDAPMRREKLVEIAFGLAERPIEVVSAVFGGLTLAATGEPILYRGIALTKPFSVVLFAPTLPAYRARALELLPDITHPKASGALASRIGRASLAAEALRTADLALLDAVTQPDRLSAPLYGLIPDWEKVLTSLRSAGAGAVTLTGIGPALIAFTKSSPETLQRAGLQAFERAQIPVRAYSLPIDTQGVAISVTR
ncbi:MAG: hypothetical protein IT322_14315 [Anaerolineae bacterium]|nr:hypothetical protein [Anaerolineae bacterium]CAG0984187.1 Homoserine kinase [Anaerolineae bacterium]